MTFQTLVPLDPLAGAAAVHAQAQDTPKKAADSNEITLAARS
jgi:hypothetical protein